MIHGFDLENPLVCEGIIGDGCGGGRIFTIKDKNLVAYDPQTQSYIILLENISNALKIEKEQCFIRIECVNKMILFNLSTLSIVK